MSLPISVSSSKASRLASAQEFLPSGYSSSTSSGSSSGFASAVNSAADQISKIKGIAQSNSAFNAQQAQIQRDWQVQQNAKAMEFNRVEAQKNRDWQELMSNTAHQREVKDLMAAGLNPVLSAMNGNGASVGSGATASGVTSAGAKGEADTSASGAIVNLLGSLWAANTQLQSANINARTQEAVADKYTAMERIVSEINKSATIESAGIHAGATKYAADQSASASRYGSDMQKYIAANYPSSMYGALSALASALTGGNGLTGAVSSAKQALKDVVNGFLGKPSTSYNETSNGRASGYIKGG